MSKLFFFSGVSSIFKKLRMWQFSEGSLTRMYSMQELMRTTHFWIIGSCSGYLLCTQLVIRQNRQIVRPKQHFVFSTSISKLFRNSFTAAKQFFCFKYSEARMSMEIALYLSSWMHRRKAAVFNLTSVATMPSKMQKTLERANSCTMCSISSYLTLLASDMQQITK